MAVWFWKVYDKRVVEACFLPTLVLSAAIIAAVLLPREAGIQDIVGNTILVTSVILICKFCGAVFGRR
jgi:hypothetical protein